jgi:hypothetical protein
MGPTGLDDALNLETIYYSAPIPRNLAVLTVLGAVFDKVYFPGVYLPKGGYDEKALGQEIIRLKSLPNAANDFEVVKLVGMLQLTKHTRTLEGFCEFTGSREEPFHFAHQIPAKMVADIADAIHGPPPEGFIPSYRSNLHKALPGGDEHITEPGDYHYLAGAILESARTNVPLLNDFPGLPIPGIEDAAPVDKAKALATIIAIECTKLVLPSTPILRPQEIMEFRTENSALLRGFRRSMLRYAADLNDRIRGVSAEEFRDKTTFFIETEIVPAMDELRAAINAPSRPWYRRAIDAAKIAPAIAGAYFVGSPTAALAKAISASAEQFFVEVAAHGDKAESLKRSGLYYLLRLQAAHESK